MTTHDFFEGTAFKSVESDEVVYKFTCKKCSGWWSIDSHKNWTPTKLYCVWCGEKHIYEDKPQYDSPLRSVASEKYAKDYDENGFYTSETLYGYSVTKVGKE